MSYPLASIIIPTRQMNMYLDGCIKACQNLDYPSYEIIVLPDEELFYPGVLVIPTGPLPPSKKRNIGVQVAKGEILAFLDDDAYPPVDWLKNVALLFEDPEVAGVGGPGVTPQEDSFLQMASGLVYSSLITSGNYSYRYRPCRRREVDDYPACNLVIKRSAIEEIGGFKTNFWPGEDTVLCLEITKKLKKKIVYLPEALVYHHRRPLFGPHLKQVKNYAFHRGFFVKRFKETSLRPSYFMPTLLILGIIGCGIISIFSHAIISPFLFGLSSYMVLVIISAGITARSIHMAIIVALGILATHFTYGLYFLLGLLSKRLKEEE